ncbi:MAG: T9SS type A sorting domain-containing protein [Crocinitomicaceae bacterium]
MKKITVLILLFSANLLNAQTDCKNQVSTSPLNPTNNSLPAVNGNYYLNDFDWLEQNAGVYSPYTMTNIVDAFNLPYSLINNIMYTNTSNNYYDYLLDSPIPSKENGWELLLVNLGRYADNDNNYPQTGLESVPYIALYNKYTSVIRVFFRISEAGTSSGDAVEVSLSFADNINISGQLRYYNGIDQALNEPTSVTKTSTVSSLPNLSFYWASADFVMAYDPCVCKNPSKLRIEFGKVFTSDKSLNDYNSSYNSLLYDINTFGYYTSLLNKNYIEGHDYTDNSSEGGLVHEHQLSNLLGLAEQSAESDEENILFYTRMAAVEIENNGQLSANFWAPYLNNPNHLNVLTAIGVTTSSFGQNNVDTELLFNKCKKVLVKKRTKLLITNNFDENSLDEAPSASIISTPEMSFSGSVYSGSNPPIEFYTPGTYGSSGTVIPSNDEPITEYPIYNEVLGVFALLREPRVQISKTYIEVEDNDDDFDYLGLAQRDYWGINQGKVALKAHTTWTTKYQINLLENLKYAFNDVLQIKEYSINAAFEVKLNPESFDNSGSLGILQQRYIYGWEDPDYFANMKHDWTGFNDYISIASGGYYFRNFWDEYPLVNPSGLTSVLHENQSINGIFPYNTDVFYSPFVPVDALKSMVCGLGIKNEVLTTALTYMDQDQVSEFYFDSGIFGTYGDEIFAYNQFNTPNGVDVTQQPYEDWIQPGIIESWDKRLYHYDWPYQFASNTNYPPTIDPGQAGVKYNFEITLKLIVDIEFNELNENGNPHKTTLLLSYPINSQDIIWQTQDIDPNLDGMPEDLIINNEIFNGQQVDGCNLDNNKYTCRAWNNMYVSNTSMLNGYEVEMTAGTAIHVDPTTTFSPESVLKIESCLNDFSSPSPVASINYVRNFCDANSNQTNAYEANSTRFSLSDSSKSTQNPIVNEVESDPVITIFPNPTSGLINIRIDSKYDEIPKKIVLSDVTGKLVLNEITKLVNNAYLADLSSLRPGIYFMTFYFSESKAVKRVVVN